MRSQATAILGPLAALAALVTANGCAPDVVGGTRDVEDDCLCDCELGCGPEGPERPDAEAAAAQGAGGADAVTSTAAGAGGDPGSGGAGGDPGGGGDGGGGGARPVECDEGASRLAVTIDGVAYVSCDAAIARGGLNHVSTTFADGHTLIVSFSGQAPADDVCVGMALRQPGNDSTENDWQVNEDCEVSITTYGERVVGTFAATLTPVSDLDLGPRVLTDGELDLVDP